MELNIGLNGKITEKELNTFINESLNDLKILEDQIPIEISDALSKELFKTLVIHYTPHYEEGVDC